MCAVVPADMVNDGRGLEAAELEAHHAKRIFAKVRQAVDLPSAAV